MTTRTMVTLDDDAAVLLDEQPPRTGSASCSSSTAERTRRSATSPAPTGSVTRAGGGRNHGRGLPGLS